MFFYLKGRWSERDKYRQMQIGIPFTASFSKWLQCLRMGQAEGKRLEFSRSLPHGARALMRSLPEYALTGRWITRRVNWTRIVHSDMGCRFQGATWPLYFMLTPSKPAYLETWSMAFQVAFVICVYLSPMIKLLLGFKCMYPLASQQCQVSAPLCLLLVSGIGNLLHPLGLQSVWSRTPHALWLVSFLAFPALNTTCSYKDLLGLWYLP